MRHRATVVTPLSAKGETADFDTVTDEISRWATLDQTQIDEFLDKEGIVNEFALLYKLRNKFPLHYIVFKQVSSHLPHEAQHGAALLACG